MAKAPRPIRVEGEIAYIPLTRGYTAVIDASDVPLVSAHRWHALVVRRSDGSVRKVYATRYRPQGGRGGAHVYLHREIHNTPAGLGTDHANGDGLDNRRANLRSATTTQNAYNRSALSTNTSGAKGVSWHPVAGKWVARVTAGGKRHHLGLYRCVTAAALAYVRASRRLHGDFAKP